MTSVALYLGQPTVSRTKLFCNFPPHNTTDQFLKEKTSGSIRACADDSDSGLTF